MGISRRGFLRGVAGLVGGVVVAGELPSVLANIPANNPRTPANTPDELVQAAREALVPSGPTRAIWTTPAQFIPELWLPPYCLERGCTVQHQYDIRSLVDRVVHYDPITNRYAAIAVESVVQAQATSSLRDAYAEKLAQSVHRPEARVGPPLPDGPVEVPIDRMLTIWQRLAEDQWVEGDPTMPRLLVPPAIYVGLVKTDHFVNRDYRDGDGRESVWGLRDATPVGEVFGLPVLVTSAITGDLVVARRWTGEEREFHLWAA